MILSDISPQDVKSISDLGSNSQIIVLIIIMVILLQATWIFWDATKRSENRWAWGIFGIISVPVSLIIYLIITRRYTTQIICTHCLYSIKKNSKNCSQCGHAISESEREIGLELKKDADYKR